MKTIIGTGLSGLVGSRIKELLADKYQFIDLSLDSGFDILSMDSLKPVFTSQKEVVGVIHLAAFTDTTQAHQQRGDKNGLCYRLNVLGTENIITCCQEAGLPLIHFSTDFVFSGQKDGQYNEEDQPDPIDWYGQTKYEAEKRVVASGLSWTIVRIAFPYRSAYLAKPDVVRKIISGLTAGNLYPMFTDQIITPTFIDDISKGVERLITKSPGGIFHLVGSSSLSAYDLALKIAQQFDFDQSLVKKGSLVEYQKSLPADARPYQKNLAVNNQKITNLGVEMVGIDEGLEELRSQLKNADARH